ncbi:hypothetical protein BH11ARM2_BH11ARM2_13440 [soil metagenome]
MRFPLIASVPLILLVSVVTYLISSHDTPSPSLAPQPRDLADEAMQLLYAKRDEKFIVRIKTTTFSKQDLQRILWAACRIGDLEAVHVLLKKGTPPDSDSLSASVAPSHPSIVKTLLAAGAKPAVSSGDSSSTLAYAVGGGSLDIIKMLIKHGAAVDEPSVWPRRWKDERGRGHAVREIWTPLQIAAFQGDLQIVRLLISYGADPLRRSPRKQNALDLARIAKAKQVEQYLQKTMKERA